MPLGMLYTIAHCASLTDMAPEKFICAATGSNARVYGLDSGLIAPGRDADVVLIDAPDGGTQSAALAAIKHGDIAAIGAVITAGVPRVRRAQPQHARHHAQGPSCQEPGDAGFFRHRTLRPAAGRLARSCA